MANECMVKRGFWTAIILRKTDIKEDVKVKPNGDVLKIVTY